MTGRPILISAVVHCLVAVLAIVGLPSLKRDMPEAMPLVVMEFVQTVPKTNLIEGNKPNTAQQAQEPTVRKKQPTPPPKPPANKPAPPPPPKPVAEPTKPQPAEPVPQKPAPDAEIIPEKPKAKPKPKVETAAVTVPKTRPKSVPKALPKPKPKRTPKKTPTAAPKSSKKSAQDELATRVNKLVKDEQKRKDAATGILQNLAKARIQAEDAEKKRKEQERKEASDKLNKTLTAAAGNAQKAPKSTTNMTIGVDVIDRLRLHLKDYWNPPAGAAGNDSLIVDIIVVIDAESNVLRADIEDRLRMSLDKYFKVSALAAQRAMVDSSPLPIPHNTDGQQREFIFEFDPAFMSQ